MRKILMFLASISCLLFFGASTEAMTIDQALKKNGISKAELSNPTRTLKFFDRTFYEVWANKHRAEAWYIDADSGRLHYYIPFEFPEVNISIIKKGMSHSADLDYKGVIYNGRTYAPVRKLAETLGFQVNYNSKNNEITILGEGKEIKLTLYSNKVEINGTPQNIDVAPQLYYEWTDENNITMLPVRFIAETLGYYVDGTLKNYVFISHQPISWEDTVE